MTHLLPQRSAFTRRQWLARALCLPTASLALPGCLLHRWKHCQEPEAAEVPCANSMLVRRRFFVSSQGPIGVNGEAGGFAREVVAALNALPNCTALLLPVNFPVDPPPQMPPGSSPQLLQFVAAAGPSDAIDELLIVHVTEALPFRPMRLSAVLERRSIGEGIVLGRQHRTWNAPLDMEPLSPSAFNRFILNHPPPLGAVENHELSRLSPLTFQRGVAEQVAGELSTTPL